MCKAYGKRMMFMSIPFIAGMIIDIWYIGIGCLMAWVIWFELERIYPNTKVWETCTPYFDKRNIHFYVNVCGFHITEFFNEKHPMPDTPDDFVGDGNEGMFAFKKQMRL